MLGLANALSRIEDDLRMCEGYEKQRTLQAAFKELHDVRTDLIKLVRLLQEVERDRGGE